VRAEVQFHLLLQLGFTDACTDSSTGSSTDFTIDSSADSRTNPGPHAYTNASLDSSTAACTSSGVLFNVIVVGREMYAEMRWRFVS
jgi:hypothetical protein